MKDKEKNKDEIKLIRGSGTDYSYLSTTDSQNSASTADISSFYDDSHFSIIQKEIAELRLEQKINKEKMNFFGHRLNATDEHFTDELQSIKNQFKDVAENIPVSKIDEIQIILQDNIKRLSEIGELEDNWDQYGASKFDPNLILKCIKFISKFDLNYQPEIFPTARQSIQIEFEPDENYYLEFEFFINRIKLYKRIGTDKTFMDSLSEDDAFAEIKKFRQEFTDS